MPEEKALHALFSPISEFRKRDHESFVEVKINVDNTASNAISVDLSNLMKIREEAQNIQIKLIIPEDSVAFENEMIRDEITSSLAGSDIWTNFITELTQMEFEALTIILQNNEIKTLHVKRV